MKQICQNPPSCFGDYNYESGQNDCEACAFVLPCAKVADAVSFYQDAKRDAIEKGLIVRQDADDRIEKLERELCRYRIASTYPRGDL